MAKGGMFGALSRDSEAFTGIGLLVLRVFFGATMLVAHGWPKLAGFADRMNTFPDPLGVGSVASLAMTVGAEVFAAGAIVLGLFTRLSTIPLIVAMFVAAFVVHGEDPWQKKELAFVYLGAYLALLAAGGGRYSLDRKFFGR